MTSDNLVPTALSLKKVSANFEQWRTTRPKKSKIPDDLWQQAMPLFKKYPKSKICKALRLSGGQTNAKLKSMGNHTLKTPPKPTTFVPIAMPPMLQEAEQPCVPGKLEIKCTDGAVIVMEGLNQRTLTQVLSQFMEGLSC